MSKLKMTVKEIPDFIKSVSGANEKFVLTFMTSRTGIHASSNTMHKHTRKPRSDLSSLCLSKKTSLLSLSFSAKCYLFKLQMYTSVLCMLLGALESANTSSNDSQTNTGSAELCKQLMTKNSSYYQGPWSCFDTIPWKAKEELPFCSEPVTYVIWYLTSGSIKSYRQRYQNNNSKIIENIHLIGGGRILV